MCFLTFPGATKKLKTFFLVEGSERIVRLALEAGTSKEAGLSTFGTLVYVSCILFSTEGFF
jgi:hypothetical protein|tara:strand:+ start:120 stop:302 length:183 start_codon:yes stop_codon:yes gene_type:complete